MTRTNHLQSAPVIMRLAPLLALLPALGAIVVAVEAVRTGRFVLGGGGAAELLPDSFYSADSFLPSALLDSAGWVIGGLIVLMVVVLWGVGIGAARLHR